MGPLAVERAATFGCFSILFLGLVGADGRWEHYDGDLTPESMLSRCAAEALLSKQISEVHGWRR